MTAITPQKARKACNRKVLLPKFCRRCRIIAEYAEKIPNIPKFLPKLDKWFGTRKIYELTTENLQKEDSKILKYNTKTNLGCL